MLNKNAKIAPLLKRLSKQKMTMNNIDNNKALFSFFCSFIILKIKIGDLTTKEKAAILLFAANPLQIIDLVNSFSLTKISLATK